MARAINVKVSTTKVIKALEDKLDAAAKAKVSNEKKRKEWDKAMKAWNKETAESALKQIAKGEISISENYRGDVTVNVYFDNKTVTLTPKPNMELERELGHYEVTEIENAIRILKMTDEETVNASTFKSIAEYL